VGFGQPLAGGSTVRRFVVEQLRVARGAAPLRYGTHREHPVVRSDPHAQIVADMDLLGRFRSASVDLDLPTGDRRGRERARFEESRSPEPAVEAYGCRLSVAR
jgi:hypothetical protein